MGGRKEDLRLYHLEEVFEHITHSFITLTKKLEKDKESDRQSNRIIPLDEGPIIPIATANVKWSLLCRFDKEGIIHMC